MSPENSFQALGAKTIFFPKINVKIYKQPIKNKQLIIRAKSVARSNYQQTIPHKRLHQRRRVSLILPPLNLK